MEGVTLVEQRVEGQDVGDHNAAAEEGQDGEDGSSVAESSERHLVVQQ